MLNTLILSNSQCKALNLFPIESQQNQEDIIPYQHQVTIAFFHYSTLIDLIVSPMVIVLDK